MYTGAGCINCNPETNRITFGDFNIPSATPSSTWENVSFPTTNEATTDPIGFMDVPTHRWFTTELAGETSITAYTDDDGGNALPGVDWIQSQGSFGTGVDHETVGGGPYNENASLPV